MDFNSVDTKLLASGSDDSRVKLWSANINHSVATLEAKVRPYIMHTKSFPVNIFINRFSNM